MLTETFTHASTCLFSQTRNNPRSWCSKVPWRLEAASTFSQYLGSRDVGKKRSLICFHRPRVMHFACTRGRISILLSMWNRGSTLPQFPAPPLLRCSLRFPSRVHIFRFSWLSILGFLTRAHAVHFHIYLVSCLIFISGEKFVEFLLNSLRDIERQQEAIC